jgi:RNA polymerase sigma-70 factor, ECF subfamily
LTSLLFLMTFMDDKRRRFENLALPHFDAAYNLARWLTPSGADADDVMQEAMLRAFRSFESLRGDDVKSWLLKIVRNCFLTAADSARSRATLPLPDDDAAVAGTAFVSSAPNPEVTAIHADHRSRLDTVMAALPREFREVLLLREVEDLSYREIAAITGAPIGTVMSRLSRGRALLKERWLSEVEGVGHEP